MADREQNASGPGIAASKSWYEQDRKLEDGGSDLSRSIGHHDSGKGLRSRVRENEYGQPTLVPDRQRPPANAINGTCNSFNAGEDHVTSNKAYHTFPVMTPQCQDLDWQPLPGDLLEDLDIEIDAYFDPTIQLPQLPPASPLRPHLYRTEPMRTTQADWDPHVPGPTITAAQSTAMASDGIPVILINHKGERVDPPWPNHPILHTKIFEESEKKPCFFHHLGGGCRLGAQCSNTHWIRITNAMRNRLVIEARHTPCMTGRTCRDPYCFWGHICQTPGCDGKNRSCHMPAEMHVRKSIAGIMNV